MSARIGHLAPNECSPRAENGSFTLRSAGVCAIGLVPANTNHMTCPDTHFVGHMLQNALVVKQIMETSKMRTRLDPCFNFLAALAGKV